LVLEGSGHLVPETADSALLLQAGVSWRNDGRVALVVRSRVNIAGRVRSRKLRSNVGLSVAGDVGGWGDVGSGCWGGGWRSRGEAGSVVGSRAHWLSGGNRGESGGWGVGFHFLLKKEVGVFV